MMEFIDKNMGHIAGISIGIAVCVAVFWFATSASRQARIDRERAAEIYEGKVLVKICRDGSLIWKLRDGRHAVSIAGFVRHTTVMEQEFNPETVCK